VTRRSTKLALLLALAACTEQATGPGQCPDYCPGGQIVVVDTIFTDMLVGDSAFSGYREAFQGIALPVADVPGMIDSRAVFPMTGSVPPRVTNRPSPDTTTVPITIDSARLRLNIVRRDTATKNLWVKIYRLPYGIDSTTTFAQLVPAFTDSIVDSVNVSALLAGPKVGDTATVRIWGDSIRTDSAGHVLQVGKTDSSLILFFRFDTTQARYSPTDSGKVAYGVRVSADTLASIALGSLESGRYAALTWFFAYPDTNNAPVHAQLERASIFDTFVFSPATPPIDSNLTVGGAPAARSLMHVVIPEILRDSADVVRATLILVPMGPVPGAPGDSFSVVAEPVLADLGAKSPLSPATSLYGVKTIHLNDADTVRIEMTDLIRSWALDTTAATAFMLLQPAEGATYAQVRFYSTRTPAFRPTLHITFVRRYAFGVP
jgi:hypothetical protein